ncbi:MAG: potassium transporter Kup [Betaproteobacteria bacterium]|nr:potassium transporter Kup [Betaproteobacteria bacterium]MBU6512882.1 potassium transporter Kup [Betaproteobacteria bacterium]MDE1955211.1 potassium transporter Kup [Betaproteobacteria bacterium]MDE2154128.1 potassium transporter Kup [Betaproteobacteria bacterium]MDE2479964.1 potassium transporter Kup [Betaproteobacteria bacterium]
MHDKGSMAALSLGALGVVYGDIGTSPLYAFKEAFNPAHSLGFNPANIYGVLSLIFWGLTIIVTVKYVGLALRADNEGEGGILALMALVMRRYAAPSRGRVLAVALGLIGAAMFYGDSIITPAISVLSAIEGTAVATPVLQDAVIPITAVILVGLFLVQKRGTALVGAYFGPVMMVWFAALGVLGLTHIVIHPDVLRALDPWWGMDMFLREPRLALFLLGAVFLTLTGGEALYADMGHFGRLPIRRAWLGVVMPGLLLNYFGQGALVLANPAAGKNPFFYMAPSWALWPLVVLATLATVIASQAVISGAYSMTTQAIKLGYLPRMRVLFTNERNQGQIYVPFINWTMLLFVLALVMAFRSSDNLAAAYGIAVNITMVTTTVFLWMVAPQRWGWSTRRANLVFVPLALVEVLFLASNSLKIDHGGWFPLVFGAAVYTLLSTWKRGRSLLKRQLQEHALNLKDFVHSLSTYPPTRVEGTAIYLTPNADTVPHALLHNLKHNKVLHERVLFLSAQAADVPHVGPDQGIDLRPMEEGIYLLHVRYGFKDEPDIQKLLKDCERLSGMEFHLMETSFFLARQTIVPSKIPGMALWREVLFSWMSRNAQEASDYFRIPPNRVVELGTQIEI